MRLQLLQQDTIFGFGDPYLELLRQLSTSASTLHAAHAKCGITARCYSMYQRYMSAVRAGLPLRHAPESRRFDLSGY